MSIWLRLLYKSHIYYILVLKSVNPNALMLTKFGYGSGWQVLFRG